MVANIADLEPPFRRTSVVVVLRPRLETLVALEPLAQAPRKRVDAPVPARVVALLFLVVAPRRRSHEPVVS